LGTEFLNKIWSFPSHIQITIVVLLWRWWSARNKANAGEKKLTGPEVIFVVNFYVQDFAKLQKRSEKGQTTQISRWEPPPHGVYKINSDATFSTETNKGGWGFVARDNAGNYLDGGCGNLQRVASVRVYGLGPCG
jgi:hypothetical protein